MQEIAFQGFKFQTFSEGQCPQIPVVIHPILKLKPPSPLTNQARSAPGQIFPFPPVKFSNFRFQMFPELSI
jgi:hypothetical protein